MTITSGKYVGQTGTVDSNVFQRTVDYPDDLSNGYHVMLDTEELVTVRWDQGETLAVEPTKGDYSGQGLE